MNHTLSFATKDKNIAECSLLQLGQIKDAFRKRKIIVNHTLSFATKDKNIAECRLLQLGPRLRVRLGSANPDVCLCFSLFFFLAKKFDFSINFQPHVGFVYYLWTHKCHFLANFLLKMSFTVLFTHLKIILLQCFSVFNF